MVCMYVCDRISSVFDNFCFCTILRNTQVRQLSRMYSHPGLIPGHPGILPLSPSLNSVDLNTWAFQGSLHTHTRYRCMSTHKVHTFHLQLY